MTRAYISGPMTGVADFNRPAFREAAERLEAAGFTVVTPLTVAERWGDECPHRWYMREALHQLATADLLAMLPGWERSQGASIEWRIAELLGLPALPIDLACALDPATVQLIGQRGHAGESAAARRSRAKIPRVLP